MMNYIRPLIGTVASMGFVASSLVHAAALFGVNVKAQLPGVWLLHFGIFAVFIPFVLFASRDFGARPPSLSQISAGLPRWVVVLGIVIFVYATINFALFIAGTDGGSPAIRDGKYLLLDHGRVIREISAAEYSSFKVNEARGFSGHWMAFYFVPAAYFLGWKSNNSFKPKPLRGSA